MHIKQTQQQNILFAMTAFLLFGAGMTAFTLTSWDSLPSPSNGPSNDKVVGTSTAGTAAIEQSIDVHSDDYLNETLQTAQQNKQLFPEPGEGQAVYIEIVDSCGYNFQGECLSARLGPGTSYPVAQRLRNNSVLRVEAVVEGEGMYWYKIVFDGTLLYPERVEGDWYVASDYVRAFVHEVPTTTWEDGAASTTKRIVIDRSEQKLYAYEDSVLFMKTDISSGEELTPTESGTFKVFKKMPSRYMQGPLPGFTDTYDLPGVPWNLYFTQDGAVIHGAYWHNSFGSPYSHGCVNLRFEDAQKLYVWAELGTMVEVSN